MLDNTHETRLATGPQTEPHRLVLTSLDEALRVHPLYRKLVIDRFREDAANAGCNSSFRYWLSRYDDWLNPERRHHAPPKLFTYAIEVTGHARFLDPWLGLSARVERERRVEARIASDRERRAR